jgi:hypothetical protein
MLFTRVLLLRYGRLYLAHTYFPLPEQLSVSHVEDCWILAWLSYALIYRAKHCKVALSLKLSYQKFDLHSVNSYVSRLAWDRIISFKSKEMRLQILNWMLWWCLAKVGSKPLPSIKTSEVYLERYRIKDFIVSKGICAHALCQLGNILRAYFTVGCWGYKPFIACLCSGVRTSKHFLEPQRPFRASLNMLDA